MKCAARMRTELNRFQSVLRNRNLWKESRIWVEEIEEENYPGEVKRQIKEESLIEANTFKRKGKSRNSVKRAFLGINPLFIPQKCFKHFCGICRIFV